LPAGGAATGVAVDVGDISSREGRQRHGAQDARIRCDA
jgi:hypothetical protein